MSCFIVWLKAPNKQLKVFAYDIVSKPDAERAKKLAIEFARSQHQVGYPCAVEDMGLVNVGVLVFDTERDAWEGKIS